MSDIPLEVISEILCRLPVKSLLLFREVCKSWLRLIDSPNFIRKHLNWSIELKSSNVNTKLILYGKSSLYSVPFDSLNTHGFHIVPDAYVPELNHPLKRDGSGTLVMGSCYGLILVSNDVEGYDLWLWNPSTHKYRKLPCLNFKKPKGHSLVYYAGLGYDQTTDDYKVVRVMQARNNNNLEAYAETMIFSLKSGSWKTIKDSPFWISEGIGGIFALGALHWITTSGNDGGEAGRLIVALALEAEEYELLPFPLNWDVASQVDLGVLEGFLSMSCRYDFNRVDIWLMRDRGERESWAKFLSVSQRDLFFPLVHVKPITYSSSGKQVLLEKDRSQLLWYDLEEKVVKAFLSFQRPQTFHAILCLESLAQLNGGGDNRIGKNTGVVEDKQRENKRRDDFLSEGFKLKL